MAKQKNKKYTVSIFSCSIQAFLDEYYLKQIYEANKIHKIIHHMGFNSMNKQCQMCYLHGRCREEILDTALGVWTGLCLFPVSSPLCLICGFQSFLPSAGGCSVWAQGVVQFKWMVLVHQVEGASLGEFTRLSPAELLTVQEAGIWTQLWKKIGHVWTLDCSIFTVTVFGMLDNQGGSW